MGLSLRHSAEEADRTPYGPARRAPRASGSRWAGVTRVQWALLALSIGLLLGVRSYVRRQEAAWAPRAAGDAEVAIPGLPAGDPDLPSLWTISPTGPISAAALQLSWEPFPEAWEYRLNIRTVTGAVVIDQLFVQETTWTAPKESMTALARGEFRWWVEAIGEKGDPIARSRPAVLLVGGGF